MNGAITPEQLMESLMMIAQYAGYPRAAGLVGVVSQKIAEFKKEQEGA